MVASVTDAAAVNRNDVKTLLDNDLSTIFIKEKTVFSNSPGSLPKKSDCSILDSWVFVNITY